MKKTAIILIIVLGLFSITSSAISKKKLYQNAMAETDLEKKMELLIQYDQEYGEEVDGNLINVHFQLTQTAFTLKKYEETITWGEKFLSYPSLGDQKKISAYLYLANAYNVTKKDYDKALKYANELIELADKMIQEFQGQEAIKSSITGRYMYPGLKIKIRILLKDVQQDLEKAREVIQTNQELMKIRKGEMTPFISAVFRRAGVALAEHHGDYANAIGVLQKVYESEESTPLLKLLLELNFRLGNQDKALELAEKLYQIERSAKLANNIGLMFNKKGDKEKALHYFADAYVLKGEDKEANEFKYMQQLWYKELAKDKDDQAKKEGFEKIIEEAKARIAGNGGDLPKEADEVSKTGKVSSDK